ncbi:MAG: hypothetical protein WCD80_01730 [Desulfobaccales bacterium]
MTRRTLIGAMVLALLGLGGCRALPPAPPPVAVTSPEELLSRLQAREQQVKAFQAKGRITFLSPHQNYSGTALLLGRLPASLKVDVLDFLGRTILSFATDGREVQVLSPRDNKLFQGPATPQNLAAFIPPSVSLTQTLRLLVGALPLSPGKPDRFEYLPGSGRYLLEWAADGALTERLGVEAQGFSPVQEEWFGGAPEPRFRAELANFGALAPGLPEKITLKSTAPKMELRLVYYELRLNPPLTPADLTLTPPPGVAVVPLQ